MSETSERDILRANSELELYRQAALAARTNGPEPPGSLYVPERWISATEAAQSTSWAEAISVASGKPHPKPDRGALKRIKPRLPDNYSSLKDKLKQAEKVLGYNSKPALLSMLVDEVLLKLDIAPLSTPAVLKYQDDMLKAQDGGRFRWNKISLDNYAEAIPTNVLDTCIKIKTELPSAVFYVESLSYDPDPFLVMGMGEGRRSDGTFASYVTSTIRYLFVWDEPSFNVIDAQLAVE